MYLPGKVVIPICLRFYVNTNKIVKCSQFIDLFIDYLLQCTKLQRYYYLIFTKLLNLNLLFKILEICIFH